MKQILILIATLALTGCGATMAERENADDASCREAIAKRGDTSPQAYQLCRQSVLSYRRDRAIISSGN